MAIPAASSQADTWRISYEEIDNKACIRTYVVPPAEFPEASNDGIPTLMDGEVSVKTTREIIVPMLPVLTTDAVTMRLEQYKLTTLEQYDVLKLVTRLGDYHQGGLAEDPMVVFDSVHWLILRWRTWRDWFLSKLAVLDDKLDPLSKDFQAVRDCMPRLYYTERQREGAIQFLRCLAATVPALRDPPPDTATKLLSFEEGKAR